jgi:Ca2+-dependent lipid-binding protein
MSQVTEQVINDIQKRELKGIETYGTTMDRDDLTQDQWLQHAYEESLDFCIYLKKLLIIRNGNI